MHMPEGFANIIKLLEDQRAAIDRALGALREVEGGEPTAPAKKRGRPAKKVVPPVTKKRGMTPEGKERLVAALKARWAVKKAAAKKAARAAKKAAQFGS